MPRVEVRRGLRRAFLILFVLAVSWAILVAITGGYRFRVGDLRVSSRSPINPLIIALVSSVAAWALASSEERRRALPTLREHLRGRRGLLRWAIQPPPALAPAIAAIAVIAVVALGLLKGTYAAGGADQYGYVSQADLWIKGSLIVEQPLTREMAWSMAGGAFAPLGYRPRPAHDGTDIVPIYPPGLPLLMAIFKLIAGPNAVYWVVPLLGGLTIWATYLLGARLAGRGVGAGAAVLMASSPSFLFQLMFPMSDVPVTAWWSLALVLLLFEQRSAAFAAGLATGAAILTRPNLVPLAAVPGIFLVWRAVRDRAAVGDAPAQRLLASRSLGAGGLSPAVQRVLLFIAGSIPACIAIAIIHTRLYGSPFRSGYGTFDSLYRLSFLPANLARYPAWMLDAQTPFVFLALAAPFVLSRHGQGRAATQRLSPSERMGPTYVGPVLLDRPIAIMWLSFIAVVFLSYAFYIPFDAWWYLRFVLPAFPPLLVLTSVVIIAAIRRATRRGRDVAAAVIIGALAWHGVDYAIDRSVLELWVGEQRYVAVGRYVAAKLPERAVILSMQHSGNIRYYSGRLTVRYDWIPPTRLDWVIGELRRLGYHPYVALDDWEEPQFRERFEKHSVLAALDWQPVARMKGDLLRIYDPAHRQIRETEARIPDIIPQWR